MHSLKPTLLSPTALLATGLALALFAAHTSIAQTPTSAARAVAPQLQRTSILVVGGTGRNGSAIVTALEALGAKPRVLARDVTAARLKFPGERQWVQGDVTQLQSLEAAVQGIDVIINAVATTQIEGPNGVEAVDLGGMRNLLDVSRRAGVKRMVLITGMRVGSDPSTWTVPLMRKGFGAKREAEKLLIASGLDYVILRPTGITPRPGGVWEIGVFDQAKYRANADELAMRASGPMPAADAPPPAGTIARADLAEVAIVAAVARQARNRVFVVTHGAGRASDAWVKNLRRMPRQ